MLTTLANKCDFFGSKCEQFWAGECDLFGTKCEPLVPNGNILHGCFHGAACVLRTIMVSSGYVKQNATPKRKSHHNSMVIGNTNTILTGECLAEPNSKSCRFLKGTSAVVSKIGHDVMFFSKIGHDL